MAKFQQNGTLRQQLLATGNATLVSDANCDSYWHERGSGFNVIGKMIMSIRAQLRLEGENEKEADSKKLVPPCSRPQSKAI